MNIRKYHINELPQDRIFVYLEKEFHKKLFSKIGLFRFKRFSQEFFDNKLNPSTFQNWRKRKINLKDRIKYCFIPLWFIVKLSTILPEFSIEEFEKNIIAMKGPSTSTIIYNPNLPLLEDKRLIKIIAHMLGDGHVAGAFGSKLPKGTTHSEYRNYYPGLLDSCEKDLQVFGTIKLSKDYDHGHLIIPNVVGYILRHIYKIRFDCHNSRVPKRLFDLPKELIASFLRSFADDEGHVYDSNIEYYSTNKELLQGILYLMNKHFPEIKTSNIKTNTNKRKPHHHIKYLFTIYSESQESYLKLIGFDHTKKREDLIFNLNRRKNKYNRNPKEKILNLLKEKNLTAKQISRLLSVSHVTALFHLNELKKLGKAQILRKEHWANVWSYKE